MELGEVAVKSEDAKNNESRNEAKEGRPLQGDLFEKGSQGVKKDEDEGEGVQQQEGVKKRSRRGWAHMDDG